MDSWMDQLHDIDGLDPVSWWPLAIGWWGVLAGVLLIGGGIVFFISRRLAFKRSWKNDVLNELTALENNLSEETAHNTAIALSEYLRRITLKRFSRKECAGLTGDAWLAWLSKHDPKDFDWQSKGSLLTEAPYAPCNNKMPLEQIRELIQVIKHWVR